MLGVFAAGRILNPKPAHSQLIGGMIRGVGAALQEETVVDARTGAFVTQDLVHYHVPVHDVPQVEAVLLDEFDPHANVLGSKGIWRARYLRRARTQLSPHAGQGAAGPDAEAGLTICRCRSRGR